MFPNHLTWTLTCLLLSSAQTPTPTQLQLGAELVLVPIPPAPGRPAGRQTGRRAGRPASQRSTFKPQFTLNIKITFVSSVIKCQKMITFNNFPSNLPIHQTWKGFRSQLSKISINFNFKSFSHLCPVRLMIITLAVTITKLRPKAQHN